MTNHVASNETLKERIGERASSYRHIIGAFMYKLGNGIL
jgi:hypothetical protein